MPAVICSCGRNPELSARVARGWQLAGPTLTRSLEGLGLFLFFFFFLIKMEEQIELQILTVEMYLYLHLRYLNGVL